MKEKHDIKQNKPSYFIFLKIYDIILIYKKEGVIMRKTKDPRLQQLSDFYCTECGHKNFPIIRAGKAREAGHLKKLYCIHCKREVNHYECYSTIDVEKFKRKFKNGDFKNDDFEDNVRSPMRW